MEILPDYSLTHLNTFHVRATTAFFAKVTSIDELRKAIAFAQEKNLPILILGGGSNILFTQNFKGLTIKIGILGKEIIRQDDNQIWIKFGAGEEWHQTVLYCVEAGYGGIENLSLIPGTVGAAPMQNIGAYGVELKDVFHSLEAMEIATGRVKTFDLEQCGFGYRTSVFKNVNKGKFIILNVTLAFRKNPVFNTTYHALQSALQNVDLGTISLKLVSDAVVAIRRSKLPDPQEIGNAGSFFKNLSVSTAEFEKLKSKYTDLPGFSDGHDKIKLSSAWLIDQCGWKGKRINNAGVHEKHALILVNYGRASGLDIKALSQEIQASVFERFGIELEPEVNFI